MWMPGYILDNFSVLICLVLLFVAYLYGAKKSDQIALVVWSVLGIIMAFASPILLEIAKASDGNGYLWWYGGWATFDMLGIAALYVSHKRFKIMPSKFAIFVSLSFLILAALQAVGFVDRAVLKLKAADDFYRYMILAVNICIVPMATLAIWPAVKKSKIINFSKN